MSAILAKTFNSLANLARRENKIFANTLAVLGFVPARNCTPKHHSSCNGRICSNLQRVNNDAETADVVLIYDDGNLKKFKKLKTIVSV